MTHALDMNTRSSNSLLHAGMVRLAAFYVSVKKELEHKRRMNDIYTQLASHSDRGLADLGFRREDLEQIAREAAGSR